MTKSDSEKQAVNAASELVAITLQSVKEQFPDNISAVFKFGSLGEHGDFSWCSDVDIAIIFTKLIANIDDEINALWQRLLKSPILFANRLSLFWTSYEYFSEGLGRFPALDRLDFIQHAILVDGLDKRESLSKPSHQLLIDESGEFISSFLLTDEKRQLLQNTENLCKQGCRYFTKFILFPVRLIFTLDKPGIIGSNCAAVQHVLNHYDNELSRDLLGLVKLAYVMRKNRPDSPVDIDTHNLSALLAELYLYCINRYMLQVSVDNIKLHGELNTQKVFITRLITDKDKR